MAAAARVDSLSPGEPADLGRTPKPSEPADLGRTPKPGEPADLGRTPKPGEPADLGRTLSDMSVTPAITPDELTSPLARLSAQLAALLARASSAWPVRVPAGARVYVVDGLIGAGKSEFVESYALRLRQRGLRVCTVPEPVELWKQVGILGAFYANPKVHAYDFQSYVFATRVLTVITAVVEMPDADAYVLERSSNTDPIFMGLQQGQLSAMHRTMYDTWCAAWRLLLPFDPAAAHAVYLRTSPKASMRRLAGRGREEEIAAADNHSATAVGGVTLEYQTRLLEAHDAYFLGTNADAFPGLGRSAYAHVTVIEGELADADFRKHAVPAEGVMEAVIGKVSATEAAAGIEPLCVAIARLAAAASAAAMNMA